MTEFEQRWRYHGDRTPKQKLLRVLDHYDVDYWYVDTAIRLTTSNDDLINDIKKALTGSEYTFEHVRTCGNHDRYRVII